MIVTDLDSIGHQSPQTPELRKAMDFLRRKDLPALPDGNVAIDGERVYAIVQRYQTMVTATPKFEYHRKFIDVQYVASGEEIIGWAPAGEIAVTEPFDPARDVCFGTVSRGAWTPVRLRSGQLAVLWPEDGHAPRLASTSPSSVMKIVVKIAV
jgi:biofilm protein TabA